ncbi:hypothetical protein QS306_02595 [Paraburkholderia bonniea]|uniref:hypothetical protein n=1 Tax=Paraburkholderia bonniea TaxID=2152891 RepID=UPI001292567E|nr:hypothetical protein [Paraburkholderia bonniea]WJF90581.1 hypothetical protein QS306_02595 [Paraburkholderia bonniea]WJF93896.1 hypothetical protein QS308_02595 [Paraburkholderia bonniea]
MKWIVLSATLWSHSAEWLTLKRGRFIGHADRYSDAVSVPGEISGFPEKLENPGGYNRGTVFWCFYATLFSCLSATFP